MRYTFTLLLSFMIVFFSFSALLNAQEIGRKVGQITIEGNAHYSRDFIMRHLEPAFRGGRIDRPRLERALILLNEMPNLTISLNEVTGADGESMDLQFMVKDRRNVHGRIGYDNFGTRRNGRNRAVTELSISNVCGDGDLVQLKNIIPFGSRNSYSQYYATYSLPLGRDATIMTASFSNVDSLTWEQTGEPADMTEASDFTTLRNSLIASLSFSRPLVRTRKTRSNFSWGITGKSRRELAAGQDIYQDDEIRSIFLGFDWSNTGDRWKSSFSVMATQGLGALLGGSDNDNELASRPETGNSFTRINSAFLIERKLREDTRIRLRGAGQVGCDRLVITEQFPIGGANSVRGYLQNERRADSGYFINFEVHQPLMKGVENRRNGWEALLFLDNGSVYTHTPFPGEKGARSLTGAGCGIRSTKGGAFDIRFEVGWPLAPLSNSTGRDPVFYGQVMTRF
jgi:hemolysin activation/secretion protein